MIKEAWSMLCNFSVGSSLCDWCGQCKEGVAPPRLCTLQCGCMSGLHLCLLVKDLDLLEALRLYRKMVIEGTDPNIFTYTSLRNGLCHDNRLSEVMKLFKHMLGKGLTPDGIACYCKRSNMKADLENFREMETGGLSADSFVYTCLIDGFSEVLAMDGADFFMKEMQDKELKPTVVPYTDFITGYFKIGVEKKAKVMYNNMLQAGIIPDAKLSCILGFDNDGDDFGSSQKEEDVS